MSGTRSSPTAMVPLGAIARDRLVAVWNAAAVFDPLTPALLAEKLDAEPLESAAGGFAALRDDAVAGWAFGVIRHCPGGPRGVVKLLAVAPAFRRRGIGAALLAAVEARLAEAGAAAIRFGESAPNYLVPGVDERCVPLLHLLEGRGYARIGDTVNMAVALTADAFATDAEEEHLAAAGVAVRRATPGDAPLLEAFVVAHWPSWLPEVKASLSRQPSAVHVACAPGGAAVGFAAYDGNNVGTGWFGPMGTAPAWEGRGIGRVLLRRCLQDLRRQGLDRAVIPWVGPVAFYEKHAGATVSRRFIRFEKTLAPPGKDS
jgi:mycothiol synthase